MKKDRIKFVVVVMSAAVCGLIAIQFYWIAHMISIEEVRFERTVSDVLNQVAEKIEGKEAEEVVLKTLDEDAYHEIFVIDTEDSSNEDEGYRSNKVFRQNKKSNKPVKNIKYKFKYIITSKEDSVFRKTKISSHADTLDKQESSNTVVSVTSNTVWIKKKELINEAVDKIFTFDKYKKISDRINKKEIDSLLTAELQGKGIFANFQFKVQNQDSGIVFISKLYENDNNFDNSNFKVQLFPNEYFQVPNYLFVKFPQERLYIVKSIGLMLLLSIVLIVVIIAVFYKTIKMLMNQKKITEIKNDLINNITHEFKTPISTISLACEALNEPALMEDKKALNKYSDVIKEENSRLGLLVENLLNSAAIERGNYELRIKNISVNELLKKSIKKFNNKILQLNGIIKVILNESVPMIKADPFHLQNVFNNLIDNAIKYSSNNPVIKITSEVEEKGILIIIEDNGIGIEKKYHSKIFDTFYRIPTGNIHNVKGHGVGLSYVKQMVEAHGGTVSVESAKSKGSKFIILLPYVR